MNQPLELMTVLKELHHISGFRVSVYDTDLNEIAAYPGERSGFCQHLQQYPENKTGCRCTEQDVFEKVKTEEQIMINRCRFGLYQAIAPLYDVDQLTGFLMMSEILEAKEGAEEEVLERAAAFAEEDTLCREVRKLSCCSRDKLLSYLSIMRICAEYITLTNRMNLTDRNLVREIRSYIQQNFMMKLSIEQMAHHFLCSKSTLMNSFKKAYNITINQYLTQVRLSHARKLLEHQDISIHEIADRCGFSDQNYFSKVFFKAYAMTPTKYREEKQHRLL